MSSLLVCVSCHAESAFCFAFVVFVWQVGQPIDDQLRTVEQCAEYVKKELGREQAIPQHLAHLRDSSPDTYKRECATLHWWRRWL